MTSIYMSKEVEVISGRTKYLCNVQTKKKLVQEFYESGMGLNQFAKERGVSPATLCQWKKKYPSNYFYSGTENEDIETLRTENEMLKKELLKMKAYLGHKLYELDAPKFL